MQHVFGLCAEPPGAETDEPLKTRKESHERVREHVKTRILILEEGRVLDRNARGWKIEEEKRRVTRLKGEFEVGGVSRHKKSCGASSNIECWKKEGHCQTRKESGSEVEGCAQRHCAQQLAD